jgi:small subunit ribosomal protein S21
VYKIEQPCLKVSHAPVEILPERRSSSAASVLPVYTDRTRSARSNFDLLESELLRCSGKANCEIEVSLLAEVLLNAGESLESALKRFKRKVMNEDIIKDIKRQAFYLKPGQKMRVKAALARKRSRKNRSRDSESDASRK